MTKNPKEWYNKGVKKGVVTMNHYLFEDRESGEEFIVGANNLYTAIKIAKEYFSKPKFCYRMTKFEVRASGLDEY